MRLPISSPVKKLNESLRKKNSNLKVLKATEEKIQVAEENKLRQVVVAEKNKERTAAVETERVEKDRALS